MRRSTYLLALAIAFLGFGGSASKAQLNLAWEEIGPNNTGNHARAMVVTADGTVWAGSVGGGLWKSTTGGSTWEQVAGLSDNLAVSCIAVDGQNIYVGTGEGYYYKPESTWTPNFAADSLATFKAGFLRYSNQPGEGVFVSNDGGATWSHSNGTWNSSSVRYTGDFISVQKVATSGGRTLIASLHGLYFSNDANLATVTKAAGTAAFQNAAIVDVEFADNNVVLASTPDSIYRSTDGGASFGAAMNSAFPVGTQAPNNRIGGQGIEIAVAPSLKSTIYLTGANGVTGNCTGVWKSTDNGVTWAALAPFESGTFKPFQNKGRYAMCLGVPYGHSDDVFIGGTKMYTYSPTTGWIDAASHSYVPGFSTRYVPTPQFCFGFSPSNDSTFFVGTEHEIVRTANLGTTYAFRTKGFNNAHLFGISASPSFKIIVSDRYNGIDYKDNALSTQNLQQFNHLISATTTNGGLAKYSLINPSYMVVHKAEDRGLQRSLNNGASLEDFYGFPLDSVNPCWGASPDSMIIDRTNSSSGGGGVFDRSTAPIMPFCFETYIPAGNLGADSLIENTPDHIYIATGNFVWVVSSPFGGVDSLPHWNRITNDLTKATLTGGKKEYITAITVSGDADHDVYVGTNAGRIYRIHGANDPVSLCVDTDVVRIDDAGNSMPARWITDIEVDPRNTNNLVVTYGAFAFGDDRVYISNDAKAATPTFRSLQGNLEADLPVHSAAFHPEKKVLLIGTEEGLYGTSSDFETGGVTWSKESNGFGNVPVTDIVFRRYYIEYYNGGANYRYSDDNTLLIATHGRGAFKSSSLVGIKDREVEESGIKLGAFPNPAINQSTIRMELPTATKVKMEAFGIDGRPVAQLTDRQFTAGTHEVQFDTQELPAGMYLVRGSFENSKGNFQSDLRIVVIK